MKNKPRRRELRQRKKDAEQEVLGLRDSLDSAFSVFNHTTDPEMLEASILEIRALQSRYGCALRSLKQQFAEA